MAEEENQLYPGADRGHFKVMRLIDNTGLQLRTNARLRNLACYTYLSDLHYTIVGYEIEWWPEFSAAPWEGGAATLYTPKNRPQASKHFFRTKSSNTPKMLYLEDSTINDFLATKTMEDPMKLKSFSQEAAEQIASAAIWRELEGTPYSYRNAVHIARYEATATTPLTVQGQGIRFDWKRTGEDEFVAGEVIDDYVFTRERDCYTKIKEHLESKENQ